MTMLNHLTAFADRALRVAIPGPARYAVSLIDRHSGRTHRIADIPLRLITCDPEEAVEELMRNRDPDRWIARVQRLTTKEVLE